jgi:hypothetical protein
MLIYFSRRLMLGCLVVLAACGGGSGGNSGALPMTGTDAPPGSTPDPDAPRPPTAGLPLPPAGPGPSDVVVVPPPPPFCTDAVDIALQSGDPTGLTDAPAIAKCASELANKLSVQQAALSVVLYDTSSSEYSPSKNSQFVMPASIELAQPLVVGDKGNVLASLSVAANGRSAGYGVNILDSFGRSSNLAHVPVFKRLLSWLLQGDATKPLPDPLNVAFSGITAAAVTDGFDKAGVNVVATACDFSVAGNCGNEFQLLVLGSDVTDDPALETRAAQTLASGKPILYVHTRTWNATEAGRKMLAGMGMVLGGYSGNFFVGDAVAPGRTPAANNAALAQFAQMLPLLQKMAENGWRTDYDWSACKENDCSAVAGLQDDVLAPAEALRQKIDAFNLGGRNLFDQPGTNLYRLLSLWGDVTRLGIQYPMTKTNQAKAFLQTTVTDSLIAYVRHKGGAQPDLGTFMKGTAAQFEVSTADEVVTIPLSGEEGFTAIGRFAIPGKTLAIRVVDAAGATLSLQINTQRLGSTRLWSEEYDRPRFLRSPAIALSAQAETEVTSPYGGTLQLSYSGAVPGAKVQLRVRGVARQPFLDMVDDSGIPAFIADFNSTLFDWAEIKLPGIEIHTRVDKMRESLRDNGYGDDIKRYLTEFRTLVFEDAYQLAGFAVSGKVLPAGVLAYCGAEGWDCTSDSLHRIPGLQHFNADIYANCGAGCSGNPIDISWGVMPRGWGESHELGHNQQPSMLRVYDRRTIEVSNNIFPLHKDWRLLRELGVDLDRDRLAYRSVFDMIVAARPEADPIEGAYRRIWGSAAVYDQNGERMAFYIQWVHYWEERTGDKTRGWELITQLYLHQRLLAKADWATDKAKLGYSTYADRPADTTGNDNLLIALSWMTKRDQRATFDLWGIRYSASAVTQVNSFGFAKEVALFYANNNTNNHDTVVKIDMTAPTPTWPF